MIVGRRCLTEWWRRGWQSVCLIVAGVVGADGAATTVAIAIVEGASSSTPAITLLVVLVVVVRAIGSAVGLTAMGGATLSCLLGVVVGAVLVERAVFPFMLSIMDSARIGSTLLLVRRAGTVAVPSSMAVFISRSLIVLAVVGVLFLVYPVAVAIETSVHEFEFFLHERLDLIDSGGLDIMGTVELFLCCQGEGP